MAKSTGDSPNGIDALAVRVDEQPVRARLEYSLFVTGSVFLLIASIIFPLVGAFADSANGNVAFGTALFLRITINICASLVAIVVLYLLTNLRKMRTPSTFDVVVTGILTWLTMAIVRVAFQTVAHAQGLPKFSGGVPQEIAVSVAFLPLLVALLLLVAQRDRLLTSQTILLDEARRALEEDHESLSNRVFDHLHGTIQSELIVAKVRILDVARSLPDGADAEALRAVAERLRRLYEIEVRRLAHAMVATGLDIGVEEALIGLAESCTGLCTVRIHVEDGFLAIDEGLDDVNKSAIRLAIYRIAEESVSNAIRHAGAMFVDIYIGVRTENRRQTIHLKVVNDCRIPAVVSPDGVGLRVMRARATALDGGLRTDIVDGRFVLQAWLAVP